LDVSSCGLNSISLVIFKYLRQLVGIKEDIIVKSMLPMNNQIGVMNQLYGLNSPIGMNYDSTTLNIKNINLYTKDMLVYIS